MFCPSAVSLTGEVRRDVGVEGRLTQHTVQYGHEKKDVTGDGLARRGQNETERDDNGHRNSNEPTIQTKNGKPPAKTNRVRADCRVNFEYRQRASIGSHRPHLQLAGPKTKSTSSKK